ncbi:hydrogenase maturation factor HoxX-like [Mercenaria mercenaria]|uniref:hydrogenase maturation factor HoxX-like n=1 Tax=Mercenaria mercenaria TaxID=6596 RepID=UPI00234E41E7|nr:hydrogenase maturation factor HoxX-like [Mercenaria mercenaria]
MLNIFRKLLKPGQLKALPRGSVRVLQRSDATTSHSRSVPVYELPKPGQQPVMIRENVRVLLMSNAMSTLTRRVEEILKTYKVICNSISVKDSRSMMDEVKKFQPDIVICPFLKSKIPDSLYNNHICLIMHPGIAGDRGASSLDWAILENEREWGVTVLEASDEMDGGYIWSTDTFEVPQGSIKTSLYNGDVSDAAVNCIVDALSRYCQGVDPVPPSECPQIQGRFRRNMKKADRLVDWTVSAEEIAARVRMSDTVPGAIGKFEQFGLQNEFRLFDAHVETGCHSDYIRDLIMKSEPGQIIGQRHNSVLVKAGDSNAVWIGQMKKETKGLAAKLPSMDLLKANGNLSLPTLNQEPSCYDDIRVITTGPICYVHFDFYNGAMDTRQAARLERTLQKLDEVPEIKVVVLMGGDRFFSTGIHLCVIENSDCKQTEAYANICGINDVIKSVVKMKNKATVAVLQGNAGAGGAMFAIACDVVVSHPGVLLTPSYKTMNLHGSEYWTYFLPQRVGEETAQNLVQDTTPMSATTAQNIGLLDHVLLTGKESFKQELPEFIRQLYMNGEFSDVIRKKQEQRDGDWLYLIEQHRNFELSKMKENFRSTEFLTSMHNFVYKLE